MAYKKVFYTRRYQPLASAIACDDFRNIIKKRKLEEVRVALESGQFEEQQVDSSDTDEEESNASTSCTTSPRSNRVAGQGTPTEAELQAQRLLLEAQAAADRAAELALKEVEKQLLKSIHTKLQEQQAAEAAELLEKRHDLEEKHAAASQQVSEIQQRLEQLKEAKHDLVKQLKQAMQAEQAARQQQVALQQQQQMQQLMQQQQVQWQQQQQQQQAPYRGLTPLGIPSALPPCSANLTPRPEGLISPAGYSTGFNSGITPTGGGSSGPTVASFTRGGLTSPPGGVGSQWLFSTPAQPPPPPPRQQPPPPPLQQQQPLSEYQMKQHISDPAIAGTHGPLHGSASAPHYSQQHQHQQHSGRGAVGWGQPPPRPGERQHNSNLHQPDGPQQHQQQGAHQQQDAEALSEQQPHSRSLQDSASLGRMGDAAIGTAATAVASPRHGHSGGGAAGFSSGKSPSSRRHRDRSWHNHPHLAPESPEEGEALPSPPPLHLKAMHLAATGQQSTGAAVAAGLHADLTAGHSNRSTAETTAGGAAAEAGSGPVRRTSSGSGYGERLSRPGGGPLFTGNVFNPDRAAAAERPGLLRSNSVDGGTSSHLVSPLSHGGSQRGAGSLARSASAALYSRSAHQDIAGMDDRNWGMERDGSGRVRAQQMHHGTAGGVRVEDVWRRERRRSGNIDRFGEGDRRRAPGDIGGHAGVEVQTRQGSVGEGRAAERGDRLRSRGIEGSGAAGRGAPGMGDVQLDRPSW